MNLNPRRAAWMLFGVALTLRLGWVAFRSTQVGSSLEWPDEELHWQIADNLVQHGDLRTNDGRYAARMPLYPLFLAPFAALGTAGIPVARGAQALVSALVVPLGVWLVRRAGAARSALLSGALLALDPFAIFFCNLLLTEAVFGTVAIALIACTWQLLHALRRRAAKWPTGCDWAAALLSTAAILTRPAATGWIALLWSLLVWRDPKPSRAASRLMLFGLVAGLLLLPWGLRNRAALGGAAWLSANGGATLYDGQGPQADGSSNQAFMNELPELRGLSELERDVYLRDAALGQMRADPGRVARLAGVKLLRTWNPFPNVAEYRSGAAAWVGAAYTLLTMVLALVGTARAIRRGADLGRPYCAARRRARQSDLLVLVALPVVYFTLLHCVYVGSVRYRVPLMPMIALVAGLATSARARRCPAGAAPGPAPARSDHTSAAG